MSRFILPVLFFIFFEGEMKFVYAAALVWPRKKPFFPDARFPRQFMEEKTVINAAHKFRVQRPLPPYNIFPRPAMHTVFSHRIRTHMRWKSRHFSILEVKSLVFRRKGLSGVGFVKFWNLMPKDSCFPRLNIQILVIWGKIYFLKFCSC